MYARCLIPSPGRPARSGASRPAPPGAWEKYPLLRLTLPSSLFDPPAHRPLVRLIVLRPHMNGEEGVRSTGRWSQPQGEDRAAAGPLVDRDVAVVRLGDAGDDGEAEPAAFGLVAIAPPEAAEDRFPVGQGHARPVVEHAHDAALRHLDLDGHPGGGMADGVLDQVADGA